MLDKKWLVLGFLITGLVIALSQTLSKTETGRTALQKLYSVMCQKKNQLCPSWVETRQPPPRFILK